LKLVLRPLLASIVEIGKPSRREIACAVVVDTQNRLLLQQRDDVPAFCIPGRWVCLAAIAKELKLTCSVPFESCMDYFPITLNQGWLLGAGGVI
jgi:hypothetical protein